MYKKVQLMSANNPKSHNLSGLHVCKHTPVNYEKHTFSIELFS